ncbi:hypothetical protein IW245_006450 [Longispora fulva]|uniref:Uncharacterized protein n=1 Tax=Longispora fulva TaxID=619741 RepID=A0A8J7KNH0_9ACTN|nr:hypothetical protein [Longispora fulva]
MTFIKAKPELPAVETARPMVGYDHCAPDKPAKATA